MGDKKKQTNNVPDGKKSETQTPSAITQPQQLELRQPTPDDFATIDHLIQYDFMLAFASAVTLRLVRPATTPTLTLQNISEFLGILGWGIMTPENVVSICKQNPEYKKALFTQLADVLDEEDGEGKPDLALAGSPQAAKQDQAKRKVAKVTQIGKPH